MGSDSANALMLIGIAAAVFFLWQSVFEQESWSGVIYPDRGDLTNDVRIGEFADLAQCRQAAHREIERRGLVSNADYECGLNCEPFMVDLLKCEETTR